MLLSRIFRKKQTEEKIVVLMYHRVKSAETDPWDLHVAIKNFEEQIQLLTQEFCVLSGKEFENYVFGDTAPGKKSVLITFDDAYADNYFNAKPILEKYNCPALFFVPSSFIDSKRLFWWDELEQIILHTSILPRTLNLSVNNEIVSFKLKSEKLTHFEKEEQKKWRWPSEPPNERCALYLKIWELLKPLDENKIIDIMSQLKEWSSVQFKNNDVELPMNFFQLQELGQNPLFFLGIHTRTHPSLPAHTAGYQSVEMKGCKDYLYTKFGVDSKIVAYPYGDCNEDTISVAKENGLIAGFTTNHEPVTKKSDSYRLGRYQVLDWSGNDLRLQLNLWFS